MGLQLALTTLWRSYGVHPDAVIGHSMGEVTAAVVAGALSVADGLRVIATRARLMSRLAGQGAVALLQLDAEGTEAVIADYPDVSVAGYLSPRQTVVAGAPDQTDAVISAVSRQNRFVRRVNMEVASHTALMDTILPDLRATLADITPEPVVLPFFSTVADPDGAPVLDAEYWVANVRQPVRFRDAVVAAGRDHGTFIEVSSHPMLTQAVSESLESVPHHHGVGTLRRDTDDTVCFHTSVNAVHTERPRPAPHPPEPHPMLPTTPWQHTRHWIDAPRRQPMSGARSGTVPAEWYCELVWQARPLDAAEIPSHGSWLVIGEASLGAHIGRVLGEPDRVRVLDPSALNADADTAALVGELAGMSHVLFAPAFVSDGLDAGIGYRLFGAAKRLVAAMATMMLPPRLFLLTRNAQPLSEGEPANPGHAVLWGLGRTLALEHPEIWGAVIDVEEPVGGAAVGHVVAEVLGDDGEDQAVYRAGTRHVPRLQRVAAPSAAPVELAQDKCHLVIGATGNIGPQLIRQLADMKAPTIVAVARNPGSRLDELAASLATQGTTLVVHAADAADEPAMTELFLRFGADLPPLGGVYLAAFGGGPVTLRDMTDDDVSDMFRPKLDALSLLHKLSLQQPVDQFVLFSSISGLLGSRWLGHYTATTTYLDAFAYARRAAGLPATAINWGFWKSLADKQSKEELNVTLESGLVPMADEIAIRALAGVTRPGSPVRSTVVAADWMRLATAYRTRAALHIVDDLVLVGAETDSTDPGRATVAPTDFREALHNCEPTARRGLLTQHVRTLVATVMGLETPQALDPSAGFFHLGMDSLMSVMLQRALTESIGMPVPASVVFDYPTVEALADHLAASLPETAGDSAEEVVDGFDDLSEEQLLQQLSDRLG
jgi:phthiocerol/phenolphthiocerol synthesis type-I polyketide synthase B